MSSCAGMAIGYSSISISVTKQGSGDGDDPDSNFCESTPSKESAKGLEEQLDVIQKKRMKQIS